MPARLTLSSLHPRRRLSLRPAPDPSAWSHLAPKAYTTMVTSQDDPKIYTDATVRLTEMVAVDGRLDGYVFTRCHINGPAVVFLDGGVFANNHLQAPLNAGLWDIPAGQTRVHGAVHALNCTFDGCWFDNIGFTGLTGIAETIQASTD
jgi:hypothetical protein